MERTSLIALTVLSCLIFLPGCPGPAPDELVTSGVTEFQLGRLDKAQELFEQALQQSPSHPDALFYMGRIHHAEKLYSQAIYYYRCCLDADPGYPEAPEYLARAQRELGTAGQSE